MYKGTAMIYILMIWTVVGVGPAYLNPEKFAQKIISLTVLKVYNHPQLYRDPTYSFETLLEDIRKDFGVEQ